MVSPQQWQQQLSLRQSNAVSLTTPCLTPPPRLRVAVDVDEGELRLNTLAGLEC